MQRTCVLKDRSGYEMVVDCDDAEFNKLCTEHPDVKGLYMPLVLSSYPVGNATFHFLFSEIPDWVKI